MTEEWKIYKEIKKGCGIYRKGDKLYISNLGRCRINERIYEPWKNELGYQFFSKKRLHRLVYELFIGKIPDGYEIDHIDTNPSNNTVTNLRAVTPKENRNNPLTRKHNSDAHKGQTPWNKGVKGVQIPWNKGLKNMNTPWNKGFKGVQTAWNKGIPQSEEAKRKNSESHKGKIPWNKGKKIKITD